MPKKVDFSSVVGKGRRKPRSGKKKTAAALEREIRAFQARPKKQREKAAKEFDFFKVTEKLKEKIEAKRERQGLGSAVKKRLGKSFVKKWRAERVPTGIKGLDDLIEGGFERGTTNLIVGSAGTGKTSFGLQFLYDGAKNHKEAGIYISFGEEKESLYRHSSAFGWDFETLERKDLFRVLEYKPHHVEKLMAEGGGPIRDVIRKMNAKRLVIDSITAYSLLFRDEYAKRENILEFFDYLKKWGCTSLIISELPPKLAEIKEGSVGFLTDAIISLYYSRRQDKGVRVHTCEILKMRGTKHTNRQLAFGFEKSGLVVYPKVKVF